MNDTPNEQTTQPKIKRYNLALPLPMFTDVQDVANANGMTMLALLLRFIRIGLFIHATQKTKNAQLIIRENDTEREIILL